MTRASFVGVFFPTVAVDDVPYAVALILFGKRDCCRLFASRNRFAAQMILESRCREYGNYAGGFGADILKADPRMLRNEHHPSRMQVALLISNMGVDGSFLYKHDLILLKMLVRRDGVTGADVLCANDHQMLRAVGFGEASFSSPVM